MWKSIGKEEQLWMNKLLNVEFRGRDILLEQLSKAKIVARYQSTYISIKFTIAEGCEPYPYHVRVPVEMRAFQKITSPVVFLLHVVNGFIDELEIIAADSTKIDINQIQLEKVEYEINREVKIKNESHS